MHPSSAKVLGALAMTLFVVSPGWASPTELDPNVIDPALATLSTSPRMERGAFLRRPARSRAQLINQLRDDPVVAARYARHFGMNDKELIQYFGTLHGSTLTSTRRYQVWHVNPDGTLGSRMLLLKSGTPVFMDGMNRIALKASCGNPMLDSRTARAAIPPSVPRVATAPPVETVAAAPERLTTTPDVVAVVPPPSVIETPAPPPVVDVTPVPAPVVVAPPPAGAPQVFVPTGGGGPNLGGLIALPLVGALAFGHSGGGGGSAPVPEPTTIAALVTGVGMVLARRRARKD